MNDPNDVVLLTPREQECIDKYLKFMKSLAKGEREPKNPAQEHFCAVTQGRAVAETTFELAYIKWRQNMMIKMRNAPGPAEPRIPNIEPGYPVDGFGTREGHIKMRGGGKKRRRG